MVQFNQMFECITEYTYDFYPVSHLILPFYLFILWGGGWKAFFFTVTLAGLWEFFETSLVELSGSYILFGEPDTVLESICGISVLDIGNAILGCTLGAIIVNGVTPISSNIFSKCFPELQEKERFKSRTCTQFVGWIEIAFFLVAWSFSSTLSFYCNTWFYTCINDKDTYKPYGHFICACLGSALSWIYMDKDTAVKSIVCTFTMCVLVTIKFLNSAVTVYISFVLLSVGFGIHRYFKIIEPETRI